MFASSLSFLNLYGWTYITLLSKAHVSTLHKINYNLTKAEVFEQNTDAIQFHLKHFLPMVIYSAQLFLIRG